MTNPPPNQMPPAMLRRYILIFGLATLFGMLMVFFAVAGRRYQLMEEAKKNRGMNPAAGAQGQVGP